MIVSKMTETTASQAAKLEKALFSHPWRDADFLASLQEESRCFLVAEEKGQVLGYCGLQIGGDQGDVLTIGVEPSMRRRGIGQKLMEELIRETAKRGVKRLFLEVRVSNAGARGLYEKLGFQPVGKRPRYYRDPEEDGLVYLLEVQE